MDPTSQEHAKEVISLGKSDFFQRILIFFSPHKFKVKSINKKLNIYLLFCVYTVLESNQTIQM